MSVVHQMKPEKNPDGDGYIIAGLGRFYFSTEADAESALLIALAVSHADVGRVFRSIEDLRPKFA